jgi:hypothetical protein
MSRTIWIIQIKKLEKMENYSHYMLGVSGLRKSCWFKCAASVRRRINPCIQDGVLCKSGLINKFQLIAKSGISSGSTKIVQH